LFEVNEIYQPMDLPEALVLAKQHPQAIIIAGGTDVLIQIREGKLANRELLNIHGLSELQGIEKNEAGDLLIGPLSSFKDVEENALINRHIPILAQAASMVGGPQIRVMGTIGGNVANGVTSADTSSTLHALEAQLVLESEAAKRIIPIENYYLGPAQTARANGEILTKIIIRGVNYRGSGGCYIKYAMREAMDIATLGCAVLVSPAKDSSCISRIRIAFGVAAPVPIRTKNAEAKLSGLDIDEAGYRIASLIREEINPRDSWRASREFRLHIAGVMAERALSKAWQQALERRRAECGK